MMTRIYHYSIGNIPIRNYDKKCCEYKIVEYSLNILPFWKLIFWKNGDLQNLKIYYARE